MQVAQRDRVDGQGIDTGLVHRDQRRRAAVDEQAPARALHEQAGLEAAAAAERVPGAEDVELQVCDGSSQAR